MKTICIVAQPNAIVPAIYGGAVETLLTSLIKINEQEKKCKLLICTSADRNIELMTTNYKFTEIIQIGSPSGFREIQYKFYRGFQRIVGWKYQLNNFFYKCVYQQISKRNNIDYIVFEEGMAIEGYKKFERLFHNSMYYHSHLNEIPYNTSTLYDRVLVVSDFCKRRWKSYIDEKNIYVVRNGIDTRQFSHQLSSVERTSLRTILGFTPSDFVVIFCGRIIKVKGIKELLLALKKISNPHIKVLIVGATGFKKSQKTPFLEEILKISKSLESRVVYTGYIENQELYKYYQCAEMQIIPSTWEEVCGMVAIEGMASGLPLVVTDSGGLPEYANSECAIKIQRGPQLVENIKNVIEWLYAHPERRKQMGMNGRQRAQKFTEQTFYEEFMNAFDL